MRVILLLICLQWIVLSSAAQNNASSVVDENLSATVIENEKDYTNYTPTIWPEYFILRTICYSPYFDKINEDSVVDQYFLNDRQMMPYMAAYIKNQLNITVSVDTLKGYIYSRELLKGKDSSYFSNYVSRKDFFKNLTEEQACSILLGLYYRFGRSLCDSIYEITPYLTDREENMYDWLHKAGCNKIYIRYFRNGVPDLTHYYFEVSPILNKYFSALNEGAKKELEQYRDNLNRRYLKKKKRYQTLMAKKLQAVFAF